MISKAVFISDLHLASKKSKTKYINSFLETLNTEKLYMIGDVIDIWRFRQAMSMKQEKQRRTVEAFEHLLYLAQSGTKINYIWGNHDEFMARFKGSSGFGNISLSETDEYYASNGRNYLILHGHQFDLLAKYSWSPIIGKIGDIGYDFMILINEQYNWVRRKLGLRYWSLSKYVKVKFKSATMFVDRFENIVTDYAKRQGYDGVICGHIHDPQDKLINGIHYMNTGCWTDETNLSYVCDEGDGPKLHYYKEKS